MSALTSLGICELRNGFAKGDFSAREIATGFNDAVAAGRALNAFVVETPDHALAAADKADADRANDTAGPLSGIPLGIKDLFATKGVRTTAGSRIIGGFVPPYESTVTAKLFAAGAGMVGKLNMDEFAMGSSNETSAWGNVLSPWRRSDGGNAALTPGGSSGGSASAVAAGLVPGATGTDTGGSIRQPAAFTGISGIKPTYGRCSRWGVVAFASSLDQAGPMARSVRDCAILLEAMSGYDPKDSTSLNAEVPAWERGLSSDLKGKRVGVPTEYRIEGVPAEIDALWDQGVQWLRDAGAEPIRISLPHTRHALPTYYIIAPAEASSNLARYDGVRYGTRVSAEGGLAEMYAATRAAGFGAEVKRRIMIGTYVLSAGFYDAYFTKAQRVRALIVQDFARAFEQCDLILTPTAPSAAFGIGEKADDPLAMYLNDVFAVPASLAGLPAMSVPGGLDAQGLPLGLQIIGRAMDEQGVLNAGRAIEERCDFSARPEAWW